MRLSTIFELLLILLLIAFAAYGRVIDRDEATHRVVRATDNTKQNDMDLTMSLKQATDNVNRYCTCNENICNCCRDFHIPVVQLKGPGCASLQYLQGDNLAVQLSFGDNILTSTIVNGKNPKPVCVPLPGGFTHFCGRIYSIQRDAKKHFKACLGLELQSITELEASLRVSCFRFGPEGLKLRPAEPLPVVETEISDDDDDDDDFFGLGSDDDDDDDDDEDETPSANSVPDASGVGNAEESDDDDDDEDDILGFSALFDIFTGDDDTTKRPRPTTIAPLLEFTIPILTRPTTSAPIEDHDLSTFANNEFGNNDEEHEDNADKTDEENKDTEENKNTDLTESNTESNTEGSTDENQEQVTEASNKVTYIAKPNPTSVNKVKKGVVGEKKKPTVTSTSVNAIHDSEKPPKKPVKDEEDEDDDLDDDDILDDDDDDLDDEDDDILDDDDDKDDEELDEENDDKVDDEKHEEDDDDENEKAEDFVDDLDDDDDEEEDAMLSALISTGKSKKNTEKATNQTIAGKHNNENDGLDLLARERHPSGNRQSKITRL
ncbi:coiled-coil domain-containing protein 1-like [Pseudomyrmex gracilis]|uniref:coiled-coil domain-containing protein 1-like n=1 Tax=Pseudomyrmex gracilis TaxID=219809 RepID=UPI000994CECF|nr:coiled-coil domain-containing protein 1-like [Pseudomyrmex gracilis]